MGNSSEPSNSSRGRHVRKLIVPVVLVVAFAVGASALVTTGVGCGDDGGPRPDGGLHDGDIDTPII